MRKPTLLFFHSGKEEKSLERALSQKGELISMPLNRAFKEEKIKPENSIIIIHDSSKVDDGLKKLRTLKGQYSETPLIVMAENPSKEYLMALLGFKVAEFFPFPVNKKKLLASIDEHLRSKVNSNRWRGILHLWLRTHWLVLRLAKAIFSSQKNAEDQENLEVLGIVPAHLQSLLGKKIEQQNRFDLSVQFFGQLNIKIRGKTVPNIRGKKNATVLAYLLFHHHKSIHRDVLLDRFWSDYNTTSAKNSLHVAICSIRKDLAKVLKDQEVILYENESYCINPELEIITDIEKFIYYWKKGRAIEASQGLKSALAAYNKAVALYQKEFLENLRFEDWCESERDNLREIYLFILNRLSAYFYIQKNYYACINVCKKMLKNDECLEEVHRKLMKCYYSMGLSDLAFKQYFKCKKILEEELDLQPSKPTCQLFERIQNGISLNDLKSVH